MKWEDGLDEGRHLTRKFGDRVGYNYYGDQDHGIFWSNEKLMGSLGFLDVDEETEYARALQYKLRGGPPRFPQQGARLLAGRMHETSRAPPRIQSRQNTLP